MTCMKFIIRTIQLCIQAAVTIRRPVIIHIRHAMMIRRLRAVDEKYS